MRILLSLKKILMLTVLALITFAYSPLVLALPSSISDSYRAESEIYTGSIVSLVSGKTGYVEEANTSNSSNVLGVATSDSILSITQPGSPVKIAINGTAKVLVSDINGSINAGDQIVVSPISGVGMRAEQGSMAAGIARNSYDSNNAKSVLQTRMIKDNSGNDTQVKIGYVDISVAVGKVQTENNSESNNRAAGARLSSLVSSIVGKQISPAKAILCLFIILIALISVVVLIYGSIHSAIVATGRNPLARPVIFESLAQVMVMILIISIVAIMAVYFIAK